MAENFAVEMGLLLGNSKKDLLFKFGVDSRQKLMDISPADLLVHPEFTTDDVSAIMFYMRSLKLVKDRKPNESFRDLLQAENSAGNTEFCHDPQASFSNLSQSREKQTLKHYFLNVLSSVARLSDQRPLPFSLVKPVTRQSCILTKEKYLSMRRPMPQSFCVIFYKSKNPKIRSIYFYVDEQVFNLVNQSHRSLFPEGFIKLVTVPHQYAEMHSDQEFVDFSEQTFLKDFAYVASAQELVDYVIDELEYKPPCLLSSIVNIQSPPPVYDPFDFI